MKPEQVLKMYKALQLIAKHYQTPDQIRRSCEKQYGLDYAEALEMSYENMQAEAKIALQGLRKPNAATPPNTQTGKGEG